jgi:hypothetical protein
MGDVHGRTNATLPLIDNDGHSARTTEMAIEVFRQSCVNVEKEETGRTLERARSISGQRRDKSCS